MASLKLLGLGGQFLLSRRLGTVPPVTLTAANLSAGAAVEFASFYAGLVQPPFYL